MSTVENRAKSFDPGSSIRFGYDYWSGSQSQACSIVIKAAGLRAAEPIEVLGSARSSNGFLSPLAGFGLKIV